MKRLTKTLSGAKKRALCIVLLLGLLVSLFPLISNANVTIVIEQLGDGLTAGVAGNVTFRINIPGIADGGHPATITSLPAGVSPEIFTLNIQNEIGTFTLNGSTATQPTPANPTPSIIQVDNQYVTAFNLVIAPQAQSSYTVTWNTDGGTPAPTQTTVNHGANITAPATMAKTGYVFGGWYTDSALTDEVTFPITNVTANTTLYAKWEPVSSVLTVTYDGNENTGGTAPVDPNSPYASGSTVTVMGEGTLSKTNAEFAGWNTARNGSGVHYSPGITFSITNTTGSVTLYAQWAQNISSQTIAIAVTAPVAGAAAQTTITPPTGSVGYTGTITWHNITTNSAHTGNFQTGNQYRADISLVAASGYQWPIPAPTVTLANQQQSTQVQGSTLRFSVTFTSGSGATNPNLSAPRNLVVAPSNGQVTLTWTAPETGSTTVTGYQVSFGQTSGYNPNWLAIQGSGQNTQTHTITNLTNGTEYTFEIRAVSAAGTGTASLRATGTPTAAVPSAPQGFTATAGGGQVALTWSAPASTVAITGYEVSSNNGSTWVTATSSTGHTFTGLTNGTTYTFRVRALSAAGPGASAQTTGTPTGAGKTVTVGAQSGALAAGATGTVTFPVTTSNIANGSYTATVANRPNGISVQGQVTINNNTGTLTLEGTSSTVQGNTNNLTLTIDGATSAAFMLIVGGTSAPTAPQNFAVSSGNGQVTLTWSAPSNTGGSAITGYQVSYWATNGYTQNWTTIQGSGANTTSHTITGLTNGTDYTFELRALNSIGASVSSGLRTSTPSGSQQGGSGSGGSGSGGDDGYLDFNGGGSGSGGSGSGSNSGGTDPSVAPRPEVPGNTVRMGSSGNYLEYTPDGSAIGEWQFDYIGGYWVFGPVSVPQGPGTGSGTGTGDGTGTGTGNINTIRPNPQTRDIAFLAALILPALLITFFILNKAKKKIETRRSR